jgi:chromosome partitioning protein
MVTLVVCSQKGGVGKTTLALNLSCAFARRGRRTLLVDADAQGSIGQSLRGSSPEAPGLADVVRNRIPLERAALRTRIDALRILPAGRVPEENWPDWDRHLADGHSLDTVFGQATDVCDLAVIDTPSGPSGPTLGVLRHADYALVPLQAEPLALRTLPRILNLLGALREQGATVQLVGVVLTMLQMREDGSLDVAQEAWKQLPPQMVLETCVPRDPVFLEASARGVPVVFLTRSPPPAALIFDQLAGELEIRMGMVARDGHEPISLLV